MGKLDQFVDYLESHVNKAIYVWGAQGQKATESWIKQKESGTHEKNALKLYKKRKEAGVNPIYAFDCSGLGMYFLIKEGIYNSDMTANGMKGKCTLISKSQVKRGCWVFKCNSSGKATHIGYVVDDKLNVVESRGRAYGVVKRPLSQGGWNKYGIPKCFADEIGKVSGKVVFARNLKNGCKGDDVKELKKLLAAAGYNSLTVTNGNYLSKTEAVVKQYQKAKGLAVDGIAGKKTITALGGVWQ